MIVRPAFSVPILPCAALLCALLLLEVSPADAHREDEYLQATTIEVEKDHVHVELRLTPGTEVFQAIFATIDTNADGVISAGEEEAYAESVLRDLSLALDGDPLALRVVTWHVSDVALMREGLGGVVLEMEAVVPAGESDRSLTFANRHMSETSVYLVNSLVPDDEDIRIIAQTRNHDQSSYRLDYVQTRTPAASSASSSWQGSGWFGTGGLGVAALLLIILVAARRRRATRGAKPAGSSNL
jgi:hypothetical protein